MLIPSIDLMNGQVVQLEQGTRLKYASDDVDAWARRFAEFPLVQVIDLDAAMGRGQNHDLVAGLAARLPCQIGGGVRSIDRAQELLAAGARRVILGSALFNERGVHLGPPLTHLRGVLAGVPVEVEPLVKYRTSAGDDGAG